jgi:hypothetical protein
MKVSYISNRQEAFQLTRNLLVRYVLTYIPDLKWCHLAPMVQDGAFGEDRPRALGKPKWRLVDESLCKEVDISSSFCIPIRSRPMRKTLDADKEEWDIIDDGTDPTKVTGSVSRSGDSGDRLFSSVGRGMTAVKPSVERARKKSILPILQSPSLLATIPGSGVLSTVKIVGRYLFDAPDSETPRKRGRPKGSKNRPKSLEVAPTIAQEENRTATDSSKKRRTSMAQFNTPASVRKAAALRSSVEKRPRGRPRKSSLENLTISISPNQRTSKRSSIKSGASSGELGTYRRTRQSSLGEVRVDETGSAVSSRSTRSRGQSVAELDFVEAADQNSHPILSIRRSSRSSSTSLLLESPLNVVALVTRSGKRGLTVAEDEPDSGIKDKIRPKRKRQRVR